MNLLLSRDDFIARAYLCGGNAIKDKLDRYAAARAKFWDYCNAAPEVNCNYTDLANMFGVTSSTAARWAVDLGFVVPKVDEAEVLYKRMVAALENTLTRPSRNKLALMIGETHMASVRFKRALDYLQTRRLDLYRRIDLSIRRGRPGNNDENRRRVLPCNQPGKGYAYSEVVKARLLAYLKIHPEARCLEVAKSLGAYLIQLTAVARQLVEKGTLPETILHAPARRIEAAYKQWCDDWKSDPDEMAALSLQEACYMYAVEVADIRNFQTRSGCYLAKEKQDYLKGTDGATKEILRTGAALVDAVDRRVSVKELAAVCDVPAAAVERLQTTPAKTQLEKIVDFTCENDASALTYNGQFLEGAGEYNPPEMWQAETTGRGYMGVNLTGGYWRRYFEMWERRRNGYVLTSGKWRKTVDVAPH